MKRSLIIAIQALFASGSLIAGAEYPVECGAFMLSGDLRLSSVVGDEEMRSISRHLHFSPGLSYFLY